MRDVRRRRAVLGSIDRLFRFGTASGLSDGQLLDRFAERHDEAAEAAFAALVERHGAMVLRVCRQVLHDSHDAQDAFQATFLVLMKKAASVRRRDSIAAWLHGVARRVAARALSDAARRRAVEQEAGRSPTSTTLPAEPDRELWDEVDRLPESLRTAVVLCYLEGHTHEQAAQRLGWPVGTVRSRLSRARERLRGRLLRRGFAPADRDAVAGIVALLRPAVPLTLPSHLIDATARAALTMTARDATAAGLVSATAAALSQGVIRTMFLVKLKTAAVALLATGALVTGAGVYAYQDLAPKADDRRPVEPPPAVRRDQPDLSRDLAGRIIRRVGEASEKERAGDPEAARRLLGEIRELTDIWSRLLPGKRPTPSSRGGEGLPLPGNDAPRTEPYLPPIQPKPSSPPAGLPRTPGSPDVVPSPPNPEPYTPPIIPAPAIESLPPGRAKIPVGVARTPPGDIERRLNEMERKLDLIIYALQGRFGDDLSADHQRKPVPPENDNGPSTRELPPPTTTPPPRPPQSPAPPSPEPLTRPR